MQSTVQIRSDQNLKGTRSGLFHDEAARFFIGIWQKKRSLHVFSAGIGSYLLKYVVRVL